MFQVIKYGLLYVGVIILFAALITIREFSASQVPACCLTLTCYSCHLPYAAYGSLQHLSEPVMDMIVGRALYTTLDIYHFLCTLRASVRYGHDLATLNLQTFPSIRTISSCQHTRH
jgi:hypothetical protein